MWNEKKIDPKNSVHIWQFSQNSVYFCGFIVQLNIKQLWTNSQVKTHGETDYDYESSYTISLLKNLFFFCKLANAGSHAIDVIK